MLGAPDPQPLHPDSLPRRLPSDLKNAAIEQVAFWFANRQKRRGIPNWPAGGNYAQLADTDLLPSVRAIVKRYARFTV